MDMEKDGYGKNQDIFFFNQSEDLRQSKKRLIMINFVSLLGQWAFISI
jgi:hypothetical protein